MRVRLNVLLDHEYRVICFHAILLKLRVRKPGSGCFCVT